MPRAYSSDLRSRVLAAGRQQRWSYRALAERFQVDESTVRLWLRQARTTGQTAPKRSPGARPVIRDAGAAVWRACRRLALKRKRKKRAARRASAWVVVMDNLCVHEAARVRALIEGAGCRLLFLPPCSPDFSPIEAAWSKLEALSRGVGARTLEALDAALTTVIERLTAADARGFFRHCGYAC